MRIINAIPHGKNAFAKVFKVSKVSKNLARYRS